MREASMAGTGHDAPAPEPTTFASEFTSPGLDSPDEARIEADALVEVADELGLDASRIPLVRRHSVALDGDGGAPDGGELSVLIWGEADPELVYLHGGGQNAHTWDLVAMDLGRPAIAIDLPGHGHSSWRPDRDYGPVRNATAVARAIERLAPAAAAVVGMSLGGLTVTRLGSVRPDLVRAAVLVDVTPSTAAVVQTLSREQRGAVALVSGPRTYPSLDEMVDAAVKASPRRPASAVRRGVIHNARRQPDGSWTWRYDLGQPIANAVEGSRAVAEGDALWADVDRLTMPVMLVRGGASGFVTEADIAELTRRLPAVRVEAVADAGHSVQSDQPRALSALIRDFVFC
jgi:pimeloyl-ACP methyl ester carboxylesterase